ncbi:MAG: HIT domain-containing protein [Candidatus Bathyarchaeia archaeon]
MKRLWSPWRIKYILSPKSQNCVLCEKMADNRDRENYILYRSSKGCIMLNLYPYNSGHLMVVPLKHVPSLEQLNQEELLDLMNLTVKGIEALRSALKPEGFNIGINIGKAAGAGIVDHVHIHIVPRWEGDTNFMAVMAETKVIPELLDQTYDRLIGYFREK